MLKLRAWLGGEVLHIRGITVRRWHLHGAALAVLIAVALILVFAVGVFVGAYVYPYRTVPAPKVPPGQALPNPSTCPHTMGGCLPKPKLANQASITATRQGPDLSNNDPVYEPGQTAIARHNAFEIVKVSEGTGYVDPTAAPMARDARRHGLVLGGYDFLHVCLVSPTAEAQVFAAALRRDGLTGLRTLPPTGDAEWPSSPQCNVRAWITAWAATVYAAVHRHPMIYTGAWWWNPHVGAWWLSHALAWMSGYTSWPPPFPAGHPGLDIWQFTDHGWNGASTGDLSIWHDSAAAFRSAALERQPISYAIFPVKRIRLFGHPVSERWSVQAWDRLHCRNPVRRPDCRLLRVRLVQLRGRIDYVAHHPLYRGHATYYRFHRGARRAAINRRISR